MEDENHEMNHKIRTCKNLSKCVSSLVSSLVWCTSRETAPVQSKTWLLVDRLNTSNGGVTQTNASIFHDNYDVTEHSSCSWSRSNDYFRNSPADHFLYQIKIITNESTCEVRDLNEIE